MAIDFEKELNPQQYEGVIATEGPVLVLAGAGSGKTRMLTYKIAYLVHNLGIDPHSIFSVTFTNKAANEMRERVEYLLGRDMKKSWLGTFHSMCGKMLRIDGESIGLPNDYVIYDADDSRQLLKEIVLEFGLDPKQIDVKKLQSAISKLKRKMQTPEQFEIYAKNPAEKTLSKIYFTYRELLRKANAIDFDDMITLTVRMLTKDDKIRQKYSQKFQYILVDEFQDTNESQFAFLRKLTIQHNNITVVGDDDQSIYSWRGAQVKNILEFSQYYKNCKTIRLEKNYRSTGYILKAASGVIKNNRMRHKKKLFTDAPSGEKVIAAKLLDEYAESEFVVRKIEKIIQSGVNAGNIVILYRINALSRVFEQKLREHDIPYIVVGGVGFYERAEIKDILAYLRLLVNPADDISFRRIVNRPRRGIGAGTVGKIADIARDSDMSMYEVISSGIPLPTGKHILSAVRNFVEIMKSFQENIDEIAPSELIEKVIDKTNYLKALEDENTVKAKARIENIGQLVNATTDFESENPEPTVRNFLSSVTLMTDVDRWSQSDEMVNLMTIHAAKGLEFHTVFIVGLELGIFPLARALSEDSQLEEARRLFYVAITRAQRQVFITNVIQRSRFGSVEEMVASPFLAELPGDAIEQIDSIPKSSIYTSGVGGQYISSSSTRRYSKGKTFNFSSGMKVSHQFFGIGIVSSVRGEGENAVLTIDFKKYGRKKLIAGFAKLKIL
ncbi:UvrD-helicase domain-containing protein [bacterium]|nr:UvrD-helicase domain-containing protein [bacterium]